MRLLLDLVPQRLLLGHHLLAYVEMLERDVGRLCDAYPRADVLPLGAGALAGSPYPLDREYVAQLLGFSSVSRNRSSFLRWAISTGLPTFARTFPAG